MYLYNTGLPSIHLMFFYFFEKSSRETCFVGFSGYSERAHCTGKPLFSALFNIQSDAVFTVLRATASASAQGTMHASPQAPVKTSAAPEEHTALQHANPASIESINKGGIVFPEQLVTHTSRLLIVQIRGYKTKSSTTEPKQWRISPMSLSV